MDRNNTDETGDFNFDPTSWDYVWESLTMVFTLVGLLANFVIIYIVARNARMRTKTNIILMNFAITDVLFLLFNLNFLGSFTALIGVTIHIPFYYHCVVRFMDRGFQFNEAITILILMSNTLMKNKRIQVKWLVIGIYAFIVCNFFFHLVSCNYNMFSGLYLLRLVLLVIAIGLLLFKEFNNCYKKWYKKDPLTTHTMFRLNIGRIYFGLWSMTFFLHSILETYAITLHSYLTSMYILIYLVVADKNFKICVLNMFQCKGNNSVHYDVTATITPPGEDSTDGRPINNEININL